MTPGDIIHHRKKKDDDDDDDDSSSDSDDALKKAKDDAFKANVVDMLQNMAHGAGGGDRGAAFKDVRTLLRAPEPNVSSVVRDLDALPTAEDPLDADRPQRPGRTAPDLKMGYLQRPSMRGALLTFISERNVWVVSAKGGNAVRVSSSDAHDNSPKARPCLHWYPYGRVGVVNADP